MKLQQAWGGGKGALRKERQGIAVDGVPQDLAGVGCAPVPVEALDEMRPQTSQEQACERYAIHFTLDHEGKLSR